MYLIFYWSSINLSYASPKKKKQFFACLSKFLLTDLYPFCNQQFNYFLEKQLSCQTNLHNHQNSYNGCFFKFGVEAGGELLILNAGYRSRVVRSQSILQRLLRRQIKKNTLYTYNDYHIQLQLKLNKSFEIAKKHINTSKNHYDKKMNDHNCKIGDFAYVIVQNKELQKHCHPTSLVFMK
jgi:hypothetical protein